MPEISDPTLDAQKRFHSFLAAAAVHKSLHSNDTRLCIHQVYVSMEVLFNFPRRRRSPLIAIVDTMDPGEG